MGDDAEVGVPYRISWKAVCSLYGMEVSGTLDVTIEDLCVGVTCEDTSQECNKCSGECEDKESDMEASGGGVTSQSSFTVSTS